MFLPPLFTSTYHQTSTQGKSLNFIRKQTFLKKKKKVYIKNLSSKCDQIPSFLQLPADVVIFTEEILYGKLFNPLVL